LGNGRNVRKAAKNEGEGGKKEQEEEGKRERIMSERRMNDEVARRVGQASSGRAVVTYKKKNYNHFPLCRRSVWREREGEEEQEEVVQTH
jgi:hypothetical protein